MKERGMGDNTALSEEQEQALFLNHLGPIRRQRDKIASATSDLRNLYKKAKADGYTKQEIDFALSLEKDKDGAALQKRRREAMIARWMQHPIGTQTDLFADPEPDRTPLEDRDFDAGKVVGMEGGHPKPPDGTAHPEKWMEGWHRGQELLKSALPLTKAGMAEEQSAKEGDSGEAAPKKRGRPAGSGKKNKAPAEPKKTFSQQLREQNNAADAKIKQGLKEAAPAV